MTLASRIKEVRQRAGISQQKMSEMIPASIAAYKRWEGGSVSPQVSEVIKIAQILNTTVAYLVGEEPAPTEPVVNVKEENITKTENVAAVLSYTGPCGEHLELPDTPENREIFRTIVTQMISRTGGPSCSEN